MHKKRVTYRKLLILVCLCLNSYYLILEGCNSCNYSYICKSVMKEENKYNDYRIKELYIEYKLFMDEAMNNLTSPKGIEMIINCSIQVERAFGKLSRI